MQTSLVRLAAAALVLCGLVLGTAGPARAQGLYYKEIRHEDRIYVFNNAANAERFEKTKEMGVGITRPGVGPNGETVVGDNERALQLFFFKCGISEPVPEPTPPTMRLEWRDGKTRITTDNAYLEISNRVQVRYTHEDFETPVTLPGNVTIDDRGSFRIRRAKFKLEGWFWKQNNLAYEVQLNWPGVTTSNNPGAVLEDALIAWDPAGKGKFRIVAGQFKVPFGLQELTSSGSQSFVDRSIVSNEYARGRDIGVAVQGALWGNRIEYRGGVFNGAGLTRSINDNDRFQYNARVMWQPNGSQNLASRGWVSNPIYSEGDFESTTVPIYAVAFNYEHNDFTATTTGNDLKSEVFSVDGIFKFKGFTGTGAYYWRERDPETGARYDADGWYAQAGQMLNARRTWEAAFRYAQREVNSAIANDDITEWRGAVSYYYRRHSLKLQADYGEVEVELGPGRGSNATKELRVQTQFIF